MKEKFANHNTSGMEKLTLTPAVLFEEELVKKILDNMISELGISEPNWQELFGVTNVQKNELEDRHYEEALSLHLQENYIAGFQTAESQLQSLKESSKCFLSNLLRPREVLHSLDCGGCQELHSDPTQEVLPALRLVPQEHSDRQQGKHFFLTPYSNSPSSNTWTSSWLSPKSTRAPSSASRSVSSSPYQS